MVGGGREDGIEWEDGEGPLELALGEFLPDSIDRLLGRQLLLLLFLLVVGIGCGRGRHARPTRVVRLF